MRLRVTNVGQSGCHLGTRVLPTGESMIVESDHDSDQEPDVVRELHHFHDAGHVTIEDLDREEPTVETTEVQGEDTPPLP